VSLYQQFELISSDYLSSYPLAKVLEQFAVPYSVQLQDLVVE
jgi:hypothetical protein